MVITNRDPIIDPCVPGDIPLANVTVYLYGGPTVLTEKTDIDGFYRFEDLPPGRYSVYVAYPSCSPTVGPSKSPSVYPSASPSKLPSVSSPGSNARDLLTAVSYSSGEKHMHVYRKLGDTCKEVPLMDQPDEILLFTSMDECCANMFWFDLRGCIERSQTDPAPIRYRFYPTWIRGQLCGAKETFDDWEDSYVSLEECCESHFSWDFSACCGSRNMGGCSSR